MSYILHDRNNEQMLIPITMIRGGTTRGFYFEGKNVPPQCAAWNEVDEITAASFYLEGDSVNIQA